MPADQWQVAKRTTALSIAGIIVLLGAAALGTVVLTERLGDDSERLARERQAFFAGLVAEQVGQDVRSRLMASGDAASVVVRPANLDDGTPALVVGGDASSAPVGVRIRGGRGLPRPALGTAVHLVAGGEDPWVLALVAGADDAALTDAIRLADLAEDAGTGELEVDGVRYLTASASVPGLGLSVVVTAPEGTAWARGLTSRGRAIVLGILGLSAVWAVGFLAALGAHGALPTPDEQRGVTPLSEATISDEPRSELAWAVVCLSVRVAGDRGVTLDDAPDETSEILDSIVQDAEALGLQVRGRMPDRVVLIDFGGERMVGHAATELAISSVRRARAEVRANAYAVTAGIAGGSFEDDALDDATWGGGSLALAEQLASTRQTNAVFAGGRVAEALGDAFLFRDASAYWVRGVGEALVFRCEARS